MHRDVIARFWSRVEIKGEDDCWPWVGRAKPSGYGTYAITLPEGRRSCNAHRWAYEIAHGPVPDGLEVDHLCHNRACCNPAHLEAVTRAENVRRMPRSRATHCRRGHEYTPENTRVFGDGWRDCRQCARDRTRAWKKGEMLPPKSDTYTVADAQAVA